MKRQRIAMLLTVCMLLLPALTACTGQTANPTTQTTAAATTAAVTTTQQTSAAVVEETSSATTAAAPDPKDELASQTGSWTQKNDPVTFSLASPEFDSYTGLKWAEDDISRMIMDMTGVRLELVYGSDKGMGGNFYDALAASGELPDFVYLKSASDVNRMAESGNAAALDELALQYCPDFWDSLDGKEIVRNTQSDGHVYTLRSGYLSDRFYDDPTAPISHPYPMYIRSDLLTKLGEDMPTSVEELEQLLRKAKDNMADLGILTPLIASDIANFPVANWMGVYNTTSGVTGYTLQWDAENKKIITAMGDSAWYDYLMEMNRWHKDGLITLTMYDGDPRSSGMTYWQQEGDHVISLARVGYTSYMNAGWYPIRQAEQAKTDPQYPIEVITESLTWQGEDQMAAVPINEEYGLNTGSGLFISQTCHAPERAILFYQFLASDYGVRLTHWGMEGVHYTLDEDHHVVMTEGNTRASDMTGDSSYGLYDLDLMNNSPVGKWAMVGDPVVLGQYAASPVGAESNEDMIRVRTQLIEAGINYKKKVASGYILPMDEVLPAQEDPGFAAYQNLFALWNLGINEVVCAPTTEQAQARWTQLQDDLNQNGLNAVEEALTLRFEDVIKRYQAAGYYTDIDFE